MKHTAIYTQPRIDHTNTQKQKPGSLVFKEVFVAIVSTPSLRQMLMKQNWCCEPMKNFILLPALPG